MPLDNRPQLASSPLAVLSLHSVPIASVSVEGGSPTLGKRGTMPLSSQGFLCSVVRTLNP
jgi:hypothetical protein